MFLINESNEFPEKSIRDLKKYGDVFFQNDKYNKNDIKVLFIRLNKVIDKKFIEEFPQLTHIVSPTTGLNHIDLDFIKLKGINLISLKGKFDFLENIYATSEYTIAITLSLLRKIHLAAQSVSDGKWNRYPFKGNEINSKKVLIIGYGRIGRKVCKIFKAFGAEVMAYDTNQEKVPKEYFCDINSYIKIADIVSIHIPYCAENKGFINDRLIKSMKKESILINTSRGEVVDQNALFDSLLNKDISGAALDVLWDEPKPVGAKLKNLLANAGENVLITPHIGGFTNESLTKVEEYVTDLLIQEIGRK